jgi:hypothetical protein
MRTTQVPSSSHHDHSTAFHMRLASGHGFCADLTRSLPDAIIPMRPIRQYAQWPVHTDAERAFLTLNGMRMTVEGGTDRQAPTL